VGCLPGFGYESGEAGKCAKTTTIKVECLSQKCRIPQPLIESDEEIVSFW